MARQAQRPRLAVWKFASCDGCQLTLLDCEDELLALAAQVDIAHFTEASSADAGGPYDVSLVEGSVTTPQDAERIQQIRAQSRTLITIGACATSGGIQALRNFADVAEFTAAVYARPEYVATLATSTGIASHVRVDFELRGCPIDKGQLLELLTAQLAGRQPRIPGHSVCEECKRRAPPASWWPTARRASARSPRRDVVPSARLMAVAATGASAPWPSRTRRR